MDAFHPVLVDADGSIVGPILGYTNFEIQVLVHPDDGEPVVLTVWNRKPTFDLFASPGGWHWSSLYYEVAGCTGQTWIPSGPTAAGREGVIGSGNMLHVTTGVPQTKTLLSFRDRENLSCVAINTTQSAIQLTPLVDLDTLFTTPMRSVWE